MKKLCVMFCLLLVSAPAFAGEDEWSMVWVARSSDWFIKEGKGALKHTGNKLQGKLAGKDGVSEYLLTVELKGNLASGTFEVIPGDAGKASLRGTYSVTKLNSIMCWETIQLQGGTEYVGLLRNRPCKP